MKLPKKRQAKKTEKLLLEVMQVLIARFPGVKSLDDSYATFDDRFCFKNNKLKYKGRKK